MNPVIQLKKATPLFLIPLVLVSFALSPRAQAQLSPAPDGGYPNHNTAEGQDALFSLDTSPTGAFNNTAIGFDALYSNAIGFANTAAGDSALYSNTTGESNTATGVAALYYNDHRLLQYGHRC